jgi:LPS-assembly lipoprotein
MSLCRGLLPSVLAAALAACGFHPLYMKDSAGVAGVTGDFAQVKIANVRAANPEFDRLGQQMHNFLIQRLNPDGMAPDPRYRLECDLTVQRERTGVQITEEATRARLTVAVSFRLMPLVGKNSLYAGSEQSVNSYNIVDSQFASLSAENDAANRAVREISDAIKLRLGIYFQHERRI